MEIGTPTIDANVLNIDTQKKYQRATYVIKIWNSTVQISKVLNELPTDGQSVDLSLKDKFILLK